MHHERQTRYFTPMTVQDTYSGYGLYTQLLPFIDTLTKPVQLSDETRRQAQALIKEKNISDAEIRKAQSMLSPSLPAYDMGATKREIRWNLSIDDKGADLLIGYMRHQLAIYDVVRAVANRLCAPRGGAAKALRTEEASQQHLRESLEQHGMGTHEAKVRVRQCVVAIEEQSEQLGMMSLSL